jgi:predicted chitinase
MAQVDHSVNGATPSSDTSTTEVTITTHNEELSENLYRLVILGEQQKEIAEESTTTTKEQLGHVRDSLDEIRDALTESGDVKKNQIGLAENQLNEMNKNINVMLGILEGQYNLQKESQDLAKRASSEGRDASKSNNVKNTAPLTSGSASKISGGIGDLLSTLTGLLGFGAKAAGPMKLLREISSIPMKIVTKSAKFVFDAALNAAKFGFNSLNKISAKLAPKISVAVAKLNKVVSGILSKLGSKISNSSIGQLEKKLSGIVGKLEKKLSSLIGSFKSKASELLGLAGKYIKAGIDKILPKFVKRIGSFFVNLIGKTGGLLGSLMKKMGGKAVGLLGTLFKSLAGKSSGLLGKTIKGSISKLLPKLLMSLNIVGDIASMLSWVWEYIRTGLFNAVKGNKILEGIISTIDRIIMPISNFFDDMGGAILGLFTGDTNKFTTRLKDMFQDLMDLGSGLITPLINIFNYATTFLWGVAKAAWAAMTHPSDFKKAFSDSMSKTMKEAKDNYDKATPKGLMQSSTERDQGKASPTGDMSGTKTKASGGVVGKMESLALNAGISSGLSGLSLANFMGQLKTETSFKSSVESGRYTYKKAKETFPKYAQQINDLQQRDNKSDNDYITNPREFFNIVYGGRMGNNDADDGYKYRGRGLIQLTGKYRYAEYGKLLGIDLVNNPDLAADPEISAKIAALYYKRSGAAGLAAKGDLAGARARVQGASLGLSESANYTGEYMAKLNAGQLSPTTPAPQYRALPTSSGSVRMINNTTGEALSGAETAQLTAGMAQNLPQYQKYFNKPAPAITPMVKPMMSVSTESIKPIPQDKTVQKQQSQILANISAQQTTTMDMSMDTLPHSELLMMRNMGKLT